ncbi:29169_t:CDS:2, partial [Gigaspora margarita]
MLRDNEFINAWEIIKKANKSEPWTNFDTYEENITQTEKQSTAQVLKAKEYFAKELIRINIKLLRKNIQWKDTTIENEISISKRAEKYKELREKMNNIFNKPSKEGISKILNQEPFTYINKLGISARVQPLTRYEAKSPFNKFNEPINISSFNGPLFNHLILMEHLEESLYIRIATNKKN